MKYFDIFNFSKLSFDGIKSYEKVLVFLNRHWFVMFGKFFFFGLLFFIPPVIYIFAGSFIVDLGLEYIFQLIVAIYYLIWWNSLFYAITMYLLDFWIVTDHRVIDSRQHGFFSRTVSELSLSKIQDISVKIIGPIATLLDFGNLEIQTAGTEPKFLFEEIPHPKLVKDRIATAHNDYKSEHKDGIEIHEGNP